MTRSRKISPIGLLILMAMAVATPRAPAEESGGKQTGRAVSYETLCRTVRDLRGKVVLVDFWAEYCTPCKEEFKELLRLHRKYKSDGLALISVSLDEPDDKEARARIDDFLTQQQADGAHFTLNAGWKQWQAKLKIVGPPCLFVFSRDNHVAKKFTGETTPAVIEAEVVKLLRGETAEKVAGSIGELIDFQVSVLPADPFSEQNQVGRPLTFRRGEVFTLVVNGTPRPGYHTYPVTQRTKSQSPGSLSRWWFAENKSLRPLGPVTESKPVFKKERTGDVLLEFEGPFTWSRDILVLPEAQPGPAVLSSTIHFTACDEGSCTPGKHQFELPVTLSDASPLALSTAVRERIEMCVPAPVVVALPEEERATGGSALTSATANLLPETQPADNGLLGLILTTMGAALAMLFTPCVFPMVPITVSFFLKQSEKENRSACLTALIYSGTIIVVLALAVLILGKVIVDLANSVWVNLGLGLVLVYFAFSLFGMYEIELPHFLSQFTSSRESKGGYLGAIFMALTFTITSFTCTGPFLGPLLVASKEMHLSMARLIVAAFVYSATFASPFFMLALFPALLKRLPKSGGWLNGVKVVMGFLELAAALKFLTNMDATLHPGNPWFFTYDAVLCAWIALAMACGLYLLGVYRLPHDSPTEHIGVPRLVLATFFLGLALYLVPALCGRTPQGIAGRFIVGLAPLNPAETTDQEQAAARGKLDWYLDYEKARDRALAEHKPLFLDFTGINCQNCRANEAAVFSRSEVREQLRNYVRVQLYTDSVPNPNLSANEAQSEAERNSRRESETFREISTPLYVIFEPDGSRSDVNGKLQGRERGRAAGYIKDVAAFVDLLKQARSPEMAFHQ
jgi:thiol:disulfide interchange protein